MNPRDLLVLSALAAGPMHGYGILKTVEEESESGLLLDPGNLYRVLKRMRRDGWVEEAPADAAGGGGERRRVYRLTRPGREALKREVERLGRVLSRVEPLVVDGGSR